MTLSQAIKENGATFQHSCKLGSGFFPKEADDLLNRSNLNVIEMMQKECGEAWLVKVNLYGDDRQPIIKAIMGGENHNCYNFCCSMIVRKYDEKLAQMILDRKDTEYEGTKKDGQLVSEIYEHAESLGAIPLMWA